MPMPEKAKVSLEATPSYPDNLSHTLSRHYIHVGDCTSHCVRRTNLCGEDTLTGQS